MKGHFLYYKGPEARRRVSCRIRGSAVEWWGHLELGKEPTPGISPCAEPLGRAIREPSVRGVCKTTPQGVWVGEQQQSQLWSLIQKAGYPGLGPSFAWGDPNPLLPPPSGAPSSLCYRLLLGGSPLHPSCWSCAHTRSSRKHPDLPLLPGLQGAPGAALCSLWLADPIPVSWRRWLELPWPSRMPAWEEL